MALGNQRCPDTNKEVTMTPTTRDMVTGVMVTPITKMTNTTMAMMPMAASIPTVAMDTMMNRTFNRFPDQTRQLH